MSEQITPATIGKEVGVRTDLRQGIPRPRERKSQETQLKSGGAPGENKSIKVKMSKKTGIK
ncbi:MAG: hypothetical protein K6U80_13080 [Firmicutes bacterium]|nr:hypothetical protein [Bacillota bacterium]